MEGLGARPRIAVLKTGGIGDFLNLTPALRALRKACPAARIILLTRPSLLDLASRYPYLDAVEAVPPFPGILDGPVVPGEMDLFLEHLRSQHLDLALQCNGNGRSSNALVLQMGARLTAGFRVPDAPDLDLWLPYHEHHHEVLRYLDLMALLGIPADGLQTELPLLPSDLAGLRALGDLLDLRVLEAGGYLGINPTSAAGSRRWPAERFAAVADTLLEESGLAGVVVVGGPGQEAQAQAVIDSMRHRPRAVSVAGRTSLGALAALISRFRLFLTNDTGPGHMAVALGTPTVVVYGSSHPLKWGPLQRTWFRPVADLSAPCRWLADDGCQDDPSVPCLQRVGVEEVLWEARSILDTQARLDRGLPPVPARSLQERSSRSRATASTASTDTWFRIG